MTPNPATISYRLRQLREQLDRMEDLYKNGDAVSRAAALEALKHASETLTYGIRAQHAILDARR